MHPVTVTCSGCDGSPCAAVTEDDEPIEDSTHGELSVLLMHKAKQQAGE